MDIPSKSHSYSMLLHIDGSPVSTNREPASGVSSLGGGSVRTDACW